MTGDSWSILKTLNWTAEAFQKRGFSSARLEAEVLLASVLGVERIALYTHFDRPLSLDERESYRAVVRRRFDGEPAQYITGHQEFWSIDFEVNPAVLIPRPDTEVLVEETLKFLEEKGRNGRVLDVGTGSGAIAIALATECPECEIFACDISEKALETAERNGVSNGVKVHWIRGGIEALDEPVNLDVLVSNPPYIPTSTLPSLMREVRDHEPRLALDGGEDGLNVFRALFAKADTLLRADGWIGLEVEGARQAEEIVGLMTAMGTWSTISVRNDYSGIPRVVHGRRDARTRRAV